MELAINELKESNVFLNIVFENITSAIFLVNTDVKVQEFNQTFKALFNKEKEDILDNLCGNVIGCKYVVEEGKDCGATSNCHQCSIREAILKAFTDKSTTFKKTVSRNFYIQQEPVKKHFQFTTKHMHYNSKDIVLIILDDITEIENSKLELQKRNELIEAYHRKIKDELILARNVQQNLIPSHLPNLKEVSLAALYNPLEEIGGDLYDFLPIDEDHFGIFISDISGHGLPAAMITTMVKAIMETSKYLFLDPANLMKYLNNKLIPLSESMYLTAFYGVYNIKNKKLTYIRCGHPYPILIRNETCLEIKESESSILGMFENMNFVNGSIFLQSEDKVFFYTDGLTEATNTAGIDFSENLHPILLHYAKHPIDQLLHHVYEEVIHFKENKEFEDDICMFGMEII